MNWIVDNWSLMLILLVLIVGLIKLFLGSKKDAYEWLTYAVIEAERIFGSQTGKLKLRYVYDLFLKQYPYLSKIISFDEFSNMVNIALVEMKKLMENNSAILNYIQGGDTWQKFTE